MMKPRMSIMEQLRYPFEKSQISWRVGSTNQDKTKGMALAYIDARDVMARLDLVMGADWQCRYTHCGPQGTICEIGLLIDGDWRWRSNGAGETDFEATKGAMSDAFKRAAVLWGVGQYLYGLGSPWVDITQRGRSSIIVEGQEPALPKEALPDPSLERLHAMWATVERIWPSIQLIKEGIETGDLTTAAGAYYALGESTVREIWVAPTKGGPFTTEEVKVIKSGEFRKAHYGDDAE
jgi:hypothetical protein